MLSYRVSTVNDFQWVFKPVLSYSKSHTTSILFGEEKDKMCINMINYMNRTIRKWKEV